jgi:hypothetical protein
MFFIIQSIVPIIEDKFHLNNFTLLTISVLTSFGIYRGLVQVITKYLMNLIWLKRIILGKSFIQGTWVGCFTGFAGDIRYVVEHIKQDIDKIEIRGKSYSVDQKPHGNWNSEAAVIDLRKKKLFYSYQADILTRKSTDIGVGIFDIFYDKKKKPYLIDGYVAEILKGKKLPVKELKISDDELPLNEAIAKAIEIVKNNGFDQQSAQRP